jgi:nicotinamide-nucleotide adenylyltransferase
MKIEILGCYGNNIGWYRSTAFLINDCTLLDAGTVTEVLDDERLKKIEHVVISHTHIDHLKGLFPLVDELVIVIGSAQYSHNANNPFTAGERLVMVRKALLEAGVDYSKLWIVPVPDVHLHMLWVSAVEGYTPKFNVLISNEPLTKRLFMESGYEVKTIPLFERKLYMSTIIREKMHKDDSWIELVPKSVADFILEIDGVNRIRDLLRTDRGC